MAFTPHDAATHTIGRARALLTISHQAGLTASLRADLRRLSVVMAVAALDTYMHRLVVTRAYDHGVMPGGLANLTVGFGELVSQADAAVAARKAGRNARPKVAAKRVLRERLSRETFQRSGDVSRALGMAGRSKKWEAIAGSMPLETPPWTARTVRARLDEIVDRRNAMVHEGDYEPLERPQAAKLGPIAAADAEGAVDFMADLIEANPQRLGSCEADRRSGCSSGLGSTTCRLAYDHLAVCTCGVAGGTYRCLKSDEAVRKKGYRRP